MGFRRVCRHSTRVAVAAGILALIGVSGALPAVAAATTVSSVDHVAAAEHAAEHGALARIADARVAAGLVPLREDDRLDQVARLRAVDMRDRGYFAHRAPDGADAFGLLNAAKISWQAAGEVIAWNNVPDPAASAERTVTDWLASPDHQAILMAPDLNYIGLAAAFDPWTGHRTWAAIVIRGPDRTGAVARLTITAVVDDPAAGRRSVSVRWDGLDVPLSVGTAGLRDYVVQVRTDGGPWRTLLHDNSRTSVTVRVALRARVEFRVRARDRAGNAGAWDVVTLQP